MKKLEIPGARLLTKNEMKNVNGGALITCNAGSHSFTNGNIDLMRAWARAWDAAGYNVDCYYVYVA